MGYMTLRPIEMRDGSVRAPASPIPEAKEWDNPNAWIRSGDIALVPDGKEDEFTAAMKAGKSVSHLSPQSSLFHLQMAVSQVADTPVADVVDQKPAPANAPEPALAADAPLADLHAPFLPTEVADAAPPLVDPALPLDPVPPLNATSADDTAADSSSEGDEADDAAGDDADANDPAAVAAAEDPSQPAKPRIRRVRKPARR